MVLFYFFFGLIALILSTSMVIGIFMYNKLQPLYKWLFFYMLIALIYHYLSHYFGYYYKNNLWFAQSYGFFELLIFIMIYRYHMLQKMSGVIILVLGICALIYIVDENLTLDFNDLKNIQYYSRAIAAMIILAASILYFLEQIGRTKTSDKSKMILNGVILVYFSLNLIMILPINYFVNAKTDLKYIFMVSNMITTTLLYIYLTYSLWKNGKIQKPLRSGLEL
jgi:hypothetical protein